MSNDEHEAGPWRVEAKGWGNKKTVHVVSAEDDNGWYHNIALVNAAHIGNAKLIAASPKLKSALAGMLDLFGGYVCPEVDAAISAMQEAGENRWSMDAAMRALS